MNVFQRYTERYEAQRIQLTSCSDKEKWISHIESHSTELTNLLMAGLGLSTLILRLGAIIQMCQRLEVATSNREAHFLKVVLENLRETLPSDTNWKNVWYSSMIEESKWADALAFDANKVSVLDRYVAFRNRFVHQLIQVSANDGDQLWQGVQVLEEMVQLSALFESGELVLINKQYHWKEDGGGCWNLHPFIQPTVDDELPYVFQGLYENKLKAKYINAVHGNETPAQKAKDLDQAFEPMQRSKRESLFENFDHGERLRYYQSCFVGRERELNAVLTWVQERSSDSVLPIYSEAGMGKGALSAGIISELKDVNIPVLFHFSHAGLGNNLMMILFHFLLQGLRMPTMSGAKIWDTSDPQINEQLCKLPSRYLEGVKLFQSLLTNHYAPPRRYSGQPLVILIDGLDETAVANNQFGIADWFKEYNDRDEVIGNWSSPPWVKWIFTFRSMPSAGKGYFLDLPMPLQTCELVQPLGGLDESAVREALKPFDVSDAVIDTIMTRGSLDI